MLHKKQKTKIIKTNNDSSYRPVRRNKLISARHVNQRINRCVIRRHKKGNVNPKTSKGLIPLFRVIPKSLGRHTPKILKK